MTDTVDMKSQNSDDSDYDESDNMDEDDEDDYCGYYDNDTDDLDIDKPKKSDDPEYFEFDLLHLEDAERLLNEEVEALCSKLKVNVTYLSFYYTKCNNSIPFSVNLLSLGN